MEETMRKFLFVSTLLVTFAATSPSFSETTINADSSPPLVIASWQQNLSILNRSLGARYPTAELLDAVGVWISKNFDLPIATQPRVELVTQDRLTALRNRAAETEQNAALGGEHDIVAIYDDLVETIYLPDRWNGATPAEMSVLIHEMVHHLQKRSATIFECPQQREKAAYAAQELWLSKFDRTVESEFGIDPFSRLVKSSCIQ
jgi:hypothetical protein